MLEEKNYNRKDEAMKKLVLFLVFVISVSGLFAQGKDENSYLTRKEKRQAEIDQEYQLTKNMLENKDFVLESNSLQDRFGNRVEVSSNINFVAVDSTKAIIQIGSNWRMGFNGVGGVTAKGTITKWKLTENDKSKSFGLQLTVMTNIGFYDVYFNVNASGRADALLTGMTDGRLTFNGNLVPWEDSSVYVGQSL